MQKVICWLALLSLIAVLPACSDPGRGAEYERARAEVMLLVRALDTYKSDNGVFQSKLVSCRRGTLVRNF